MVALLLAALFCRSQHDNELHALLVNHTPEVLYGGRQRALRCNEELVGARSGRVNVVRVYVGVIDVFRSLEQTHAGVLDFTSEW